MVILRKFKSLVGILKYQSGEMIDKIVVNYYPIKHIDILDPKNWERSFSDPFNFYLNCYRFFKKSLPKNYKVHREYFSLNNRGFGSDAHHTMWYFLFKNFKFKNFLEIGVYRGQVISYFALMQKNYDLSQNVFGISPFESIGDSVSNYISELNYEQDVLINFNHFHLEVPNLVKAYSTDNVAKTLFESKKWECIYIDGNHDYEIATKDWEISAANLKVNGLIVMDDASLYCKDNLPNMVKFRGHPGPSKVVNEIDKNVFIEIVRLGHIRVYKKVK